MQGVAENLGVIRSRIADACGRRPAGMGEVELIAVSKTFPAGLIGEAVAAGQRIFGESKLQEAEPKIAELPSGLSWHFIGRVQRNKVRKLLSSFQVIHGIDSARLAEHTDRIAGEMGIRAKIFLQFNVGEEESKGGFSAAELESCFDSLWEWKNLEILGLMAIPPEGRDAEAARPWFRQLRELRDGLEKRSGARLPALSMGMSGDFEVAVEEGATHVRVGSAIFGKRAYRVEGELG